MSLILEALRKLEREKKVPERGLVVTGATVWAAPEPRRGLRLALVALAGVLLGGGLWLWFGHTAHAPAPPSPAAAPSPFTAAATTTPADSAIPAPTPAPAIPVPGTAASPPARPALQARDTPPVRTSPTAAVIDDASGDEAAGDNPSGDEAAGDNPSGGDRDDATHAPTTTPSAAPAGATDIVLQAVTERDGQPLAIVNGRLVREGDAFDGIRILRIHAAEIEIEVGGRRRTVGF